MQKRYKPATSYNNVIEFPYNARVLNLLLNFPDCLDVAPEKIVTISKMEKLRHRLCISS